MYCKPVSNVQLWKSRSTDSNLILIVSSRKCRWYWYRKLIKSNSSSKTTIKNKQNKVKSAVNLHWFSMWRAIEWAHSQLLVRTTHSRLSKLLFSCEICACSSKYLVTCRLWNTTYENFNLISEIFLNNTRIWYEY